MFDKVKTLFSSKYQPDKVTKLEQKAKAAARVAKAKKTLREANTESANPVKRLIAKKMTEGAKKHEVKMRSLEAQAKTAELSPQIAMDKQRADSAVKIAKAKTASKFAGYTAMAKGLSDLGKGLTANSNANQRAYMSGLKDIVDDINGPDDGDSGLKQGVE